jgi:hypothetical protein
MAVLIEAISVVVRLADIQAKYAGGWDQFVTDAPRETLCADSHVARVGFLAPEDSTAFVAGLEQRGLTAVRDGRSAEIAVVDQASGPSHPVDWLEFGTIPFADGTVTVARAVGDTENVLMTPEGWRYESSISAAVAAGIAGEAEEDGPVH